MTTPRLGLRLGLKMPTGVSVSTDILKAALWKMDQHTEYPPDAEEKAVELVVEQAELFATREADP